MSGRTFPRTALILPVACMSMSVAAMAQNASPGQIADSVVGQVGKRQAREQGTTGIAPLDRVDGRVQNRIQSRIRNRIDRYYNPQTSTTSAFNEAEDQARAASLSPRR